MPRTATRIFTPPAHVPDGDGWEEVVFADQLTCCVCCEEPWCAKHRMHYGECDCIGPTQDDVEYVEVDGVLFGRRIEED